MQPAVAEKAVRAVWGRDFERLPVDCCKEVQDSSGCGEASEEGRHCALPDWMEEGLVEIVEMMQAISFSKHRCLSST